MNNRIQVFLIFLIAGAVNLIYAMPEHLWSDSEGWVEVSFGYAYSVPLRENTGGGHNFNLNFSFLNHDNLGLGQE